MKQKKRYEVGLCVNLLINLLKQFDRFVASGASEKTKTISLSIVIFLYCVFTNDKLFESFFNSKYVINYNEKNSYNLVNKKYTLRRKP